MLADGCREAFDECFSVGSVLGTGTTCTVRRCTELSTGNAFAVKVRAAWLWQNGMVLHPQHDTDTAFATVVQMLDKRMYALLNAKRGEHGGWHTLQQEIAALHRAQPHPNVVCLHRVFEDDAVVYLVMEHLAGGSLLELIVSRGTGASESEAKLVMAQLFAGLHHLHEQGVVHRDIKVSRHCCSCRRTRGCDFVRAPMACLCCPSWRM